MTYYLNYDFDIIEIKNNVLMDRSYFVFSKDGPISFIRIFYH